jgi:hypothetical protein
MTDVAVLEPLLKEIVEELHRAERKFPAWPADVIHQAAIVAEECGELVQASIDMFYSHYDVPSPREMVRAEAVQTAAMCLRLLLHLGDVGVELTVKGGTGND